MPDHESLITVDLRLIPEGTEMTFTHARLLDQPTCDSHRHGWNGAFDKLDALFARSAWDATAASR
jgi:hypothetical protein